MERGNDHMLKKLHAYIEEFNRNDEEIYKQLIPNTDAEPFLSRQIPLIDCPDKQLEKIYYFRWWTFRKHIKETEKGHILTEFLPDVRWSGPYNSISCPVGFHIREGRWLKDPDNWLKEYISFWLDGIGDAHRYSTWLAHAVLEYCTLKDDFDYAAETLPRLVAFFEEREKNHKTECGLYRSKDVFDGMEFSISGSGLRPTLNAYVWADAVAISKIADIAGDTATYERFLKIATQMRELIDKLLWDGDFYKTIPLGADDSGSFFARPQIPPEHDARELLGYIPWYFDLPEDGKDAAFSHLLQEDGFKAPYGLTTAEQRHPRFMYDTVHECVWCGPVWPFATSQTLVAVANLLRNRTQTVLSKNDYYEMLLQYANSHLLIGENGIAVPWIDENLHPYTGKWLCRELLKEQGWPFRNGGYERGKDYNHSLFCDLVLSGLFGISVENGAFSATPLIPDTWNYFRVENLWLKGQQYRIVYDKDGSHYGLGTGLLIQKC